MKKTIALLALVLSLGAFAQDAVKIELNAEKIDVNASAATVVRTNKTPGTVELTFRVPMANSVCERYETRHVLRSSGVYCGYDTFTSRVSTGRTCVRKNPYNNECLQWGESYRTQTTQRPRTCMVPETFCAAYGTATSYETDSMKLKFKDLPALGDSESETFSVVATQKRYDSGSVVYEVKTLETLREYEINRKKILFFNTDTYVISEK
jgi:hypothetical protein